MSTHIEAKKGEIAETVLMPGDPLRAKYVAETYLDSPQCYNRVRGMLGFTGTYRGKRVSVQGSGMGIPSMMIYANELFAEYDVKNIIRIGTCGGLGKKIKIKDLLLASTACTTSAINKTRFMGYDFAPSASFELLHRAYHHAQRLGFGERTHVAPILSEDEFYGHDEGLAKIFADHGVAAVDMEAAGLYTLGAKYDRNVLTICTVSNHIFTGEETSAEEREKTFTDMMEVALETACK